MFMQFFLTHLFEFDFLDFCLDSVEFFKCMTWQSIFLFVLLFIHFFLSFWMVYSGQCRLSWMIFQLEASFLIWGSFWKGSSFGSKGCSRHLPKGKGMTQKCFICVRKELGLWFKGLLISFLLAREGYGSEGS